MISADYLAKAQSEISEEEMEGVAGGAWYDRCGMGTTDM